MTSVTFLPPAWADVIYFKSGETIKGLVVEEHRDRIVINTEQGERPIFRREIEEVFYDDPERNYLYLGNQAIEAGDLSLARGLFRKALQIYPHFEEASDALNRLEDVTQKLTSSLPIPDPLAALKERWGLILSPTTEASPPLERDRPVVLFVLENSLAARSGILPGDALVSLWGESLAYLLSAQVAEILLGPAGSSVKLTIQRSIALGPATSRGTRWPGTQLSMKRWGLTVGEVMPGSVAAAGGIRPTDRIVKIDEQLTRYLPLGNARKALHAGRARGVTLVIHRDLIFKRE